MDQLLLVGLVGDPCCLHHNLFHEHAAHVVGPHGQGDLRKLQTLGQPSRLNMGDIVKEYPRDGHDFKIIHTRCREEIRHARPCR